MMKQKPTRKVILMAGNMPTHKFKAGNIEAAVWSNKKEIDGAQVEFRTISLSRSYKKKGEDLWRNDVINMRRNDIQKAIIVLQKAQEELLLKQQEEDDE
jgi:hypothetical protein